MDPNDWRRLRTHQRRLRSLSEVRVGFSKEEIGKAPKGCCYFLTLHDSLESPPFFKSASLFRSRLLRFQIPDQSLISKSIGSRQKFALILWSEAASASLSSSTSSLVQVTKLEVDTLKMSFCGTNVPEKYDLSTGPVFFLNFLNGFYIPSESFQSIHSKVTLEEQVLSVAASQQSLKKSCDRDSFRRIVTVNKSVDDVVASSARYRQTISDLIEQRKTVLEKLKARERLRARVGVLTEERDRIANLLKKNSVDNDKQRTARNEEALKLKAQLAELKEENVKVAETERECVNLRDEMVKINAQVAMRRRQLISELTMIYPIYKDEQNEFFICSVKLPNAEEYSKLDDMSLSVALGYVAHVTMMIHKFLNLPLRFSIHHMGSRSTMRDHITEQLNDREREFPLFTKGKERYLFNYAVYLLNKNIAQLRYYCGLPTKEMRNTLPNILALLESRVGPRSVTIQPASSPSRTTHSSFSLSVPTGDMDRGRSDSSHADDIEHSTTTNDSSFREPVQQDAVDVKQLRCESTLSTTSSFVNISI